VKSWLTGENRLRGSRNASNEFALHILRRITELYSEDTVSKLDILDFGCGDALIAEKISQNVAGIKICDITDAYLSSDRRENFDFCLVDDLLTKYSKQKFDVIYSFGVIQYLNVPNYEQVMLSLRHLLKPDGFIIHCNILDRHKMFEYYHRPTSLKKMLKFIVSGGIRSYLTNQIWNDGSRWHDIHVLRNISTLNSFALPGYSGERTDLIFEKK
jgi:2-polyprenyl-3-methyl-5-hydroxy-6-metoxy-1,4-benzoquinol methylase